MFAIVRYMTALGIAVVMAVLSFAAFAGGLQSWPDMPPRIPDPMPANPRRLEAEGMGLINQLAPVPRNEYTDMAEALALRWIEKVLAPAFAPPPQSRFVLLPMDRKADLVDRMMLAYAADGAKVTVVQSAGVFLLEIDRPEWIKAKRLLKTEEILAEVRRVFKDGQAIKVAADYESQGWMTADRDQVAKHIWFNSMGWTQSEGHLALWFLKETGGPYMPSLSPREGYKWFSFVRGEDSHSKSEVKKPPVEPPVKGN